MGKKSLRSKQLNACSIVCILLLLAVAGCGETKDNHPAPTAQPKTELLVAVFEGGYGRAFWDEAARAFEAEHPGAEVVILAHPEIGDIIRPNVIAGNPPDFVFLPSTNSSYVTRGMIEDHSIADISDVIGQVQDEFLPGFLESPACMPYEDGKVYLAPIYYSVTGLWYNRSYFDTHNIEVPADWQTFFKLGEQLKEESGRCLFTYQGLYPSYFECMLIPAIASGAGEEAMRACERFEDGAWRDPKVREVLENIARIGTGGYLLPGSTAFDHIEAQSRWLQGEALFHPNGGWVESEMKTYPREAGFEFGFAAPPVLEAGGDCYIYTAVEEVFIPAAADEKELAKEFLLFLYSDQALELNAQLAGGVPPVKGAAEKTKGHVSDAVYQSYVLLNEGYRPYITNYAMLPGNDVVPRNIIYDKVGAVLDGTLSVDEWVEEMEQVGALLREASNDDYSSAQTPPFGGLQ